MWDKVEQLLSQRIGAWIKRLKENPVEMVCILLTILQIWSQREIYRKDKQIETLNMTLFTTQQEMHKENREDNLFFREAVMEFQPIAKSILNDKTNSDSDTSPVVNSTIRK